MDVCVIYISLCDLFEALPIPYCHCFIENITLNMCELLSQCGNVWNSVLRGSVIVIGTP